jgi:hypothetical protein
MDVESSQIKVPVGLVSSINSFKKRYWTISKLLFPCRQTRHLVFFFIEEFFKRLLSKKQKKLSGVKFKWSRETASTFFFTFSENK